MSFLQRLFRKKERAESVVLIDIGADSVAGAYVRYAPGELPILLYIRRLPVEARRGEPRKLAMLRALGVLGEALIREGAPALARATGTGSVGHILVSFDAPWQKISMRTEYLEQETPFVFTHVLANALLEKTLDKTLSGPFVDERIVGTILNGYETREPYGVKARRAAVVALTSAVDASVAADVISALRGIYHTKRITPAAAGSLRYQALRKAFPHERNALIIDAMGRATLVALVRKGLLAALAEAPGSRGGSAYARRVGDTLAELAKRYPLPRTIFLLAREPDAAALRQDLDPANLGNLWLSDNPSKLVSVLPGALGALVRQSSAFSPDLMLLLMALSLYVSHRATGNSA